MVLGHAVLATHEDHLQVQLVPGRLGEPPAERRAHFVGVSLLEAVGEAPAQGAAVDVRVDGERRDAERLCAHLRE